MWSKYTHQLFMKCKPALNDTSVLAAACSGAGSLAVWYGMVWNSVGGGGMVWYGMVWWGVVW